MLINISYLIVIFCVSAQYCTIILSEYISSEKESQIQFIYPKSSNTFLIHPKSILKRFNTEYSRLLLTCTRPHAIKQFLLLLI